MHCSSPVYAQCNIHHLLHNRLPYVLSADTTCLHTRQTKEANGTFKACEQKQESTLSQDWFIHSHKQQDHFTHIPRIHHTTVSLFQHDVRKLNGT